MVCFTHIKMGFIVIDSNFFLVLVVIVVNMGCNGTNIDYIILINTD